MRAEKRLLTRDYVARLNASPFFLAVNYRGLNVAQFGELRRRLAKAGAEMHVVKNSVFRLAVRDTGLGELGESLSGQVAAVTGNRDVSLAAKVLKTFQSEFDKPKVQFGCLGNRQLSQADVMALADLPPLNELRGRLLGVLQAPGTRLVRLLNTPATQLARVLKARAEAIQ